MIVGAGIAGLTAGRLLTERGHRVVICEARERIGGRVETITIDGCLIETAGQWIAPSHEYMLNLASEAGVDLISPSEGDLLIRLGERTIRVRQNDEGDHILTPFEISDLGQGVLRYRRLAHKIASDPEWTSQHSSWLSQPLQRWVSANLRTPGGQREFISMICLSMNRPIETITVDQAIAHTGSHLDLESLYAASGALQQRRVDGGMSRLCDYLAHAIGYNSIRLSMPVSSCVEDKDRVLITGSNESISARYALITIPIWMSTQLDYSPALPSWRVESAQAVSPGSVIKSFAIYDSPWWKDHGLSGQMSADCADVHVTFDCSHSGRGIIMGFFEGDSADQAARLDKSGRDRLFTDALADIFGDEVYQPHRYIDRIWAEEPYSRGSHGAHFSPGIWTHHGQRLSQPHGRIHFAGAEYASRFNGYLEGAVTSAQEQAEIIANLIEAR